MRRALAPRRTWRGPARGDDGAHAVTAGGNHGGVGDSTPGAAGRCRVVADAHLVTALVIHDGTTSRMLSSVKHTARKV